MFFSQRSPVPKHIIEALLEGKKTLTELADLTDISKQGLLKHTTRLEDQGLIQSESLAGRGGEKSFHLASATILLSVNEEGYALSCSAEGFLDQDYPLLIQIPQLQFRQVLKEYLMALQGADTSFSAVVFGSLAEGQASEESDIDLCLIKQSWDEQSQEDLQEALSELMIEKDLPHPVSPTFLTYPQLKTPSTDIQKEIVSNGVLIFSKESMGQKNLWKILKRYKSI